MDKTESKDVDEEDLRRMRFQRPDGWCESGTRAKDPSLPSRKRESGISPLVVFPVIAASEHTDCWVPRDSRKVVI